MLQTARRVLSLMGAAVALLFLARSVRGRFLAVEVAGTSMSPALEPGDYILVRRGRLPHDAAGLVVYLQGPEQRPMLKRVIGLPGESLRAGDHVEVNTRLLLEPYAHGEPDPHQYRAMHRLGADEYFVLGDHRDASTDSRDFGPIRASAIEGIAFVRYWPPERLGRIHRAPRVFGGVDAGAVLTDTRSS
jgi:signal peptidase I